MAFFGMDAGAAGVMVAPIPGLKSDEQVYGYFEQVAKRLEGIPWVLQVLLNRLFPFTH